MRGPVDPESRRRLLRMAWQGTGAAIALAAMPGLATAGPRPRLGRDPFTLGIAAGDPDPQGAVLWTRPGHAPAGAAWRCRRGAGAGPFGARGGQWPAPGPRLLLSIRLRWR
ncbi:hypothetical protein G6F40_017217 [Rhizopus arrhizus]|nr:hypothetical protein G6F40_017217 [Rhizopus arrhizus]